MEELKFKNTSKLDLEEIAILEGFAIKKSIWLMSIIFALLFVGSGVGLLFWNTTAGIIAIICGVLGGIFLLPYLIKENVKKQNEQMLGGKKYLYTYEVYKDKMVVKTQSANTNENEYQDEIEKDIELKDLFQVVCYKQRLFVFVNAQQSFILNYKGMTHGTIGGLIEHLKSKGIKILEK